MRSAWLAWSEHGTGSHARRAERGAANTAASEAEILRRRPDPRHPTAPPRHPAYTLVGQRRSLASEYDDWPAVTQREMRVAHDLITDASAFDLEAYFSRIGYDGPREATLDVVRQLQLRHTLAIPFDNLDSILRRPVGLHTDALVRNPRAARRLLLRTEPPLRPCARHAPVPPLVFPDRRPR